MKDTSIYKIVASSVICGVIIGAVWTYWFQSDSRLKEAADRYRQGEQANTIAERKEAFNGALDLYLSLEQQYHPQFGDGKLYYNIGNTYFQLEKYPWAVLYYLTAQRLMPRSEVVERNLSLAKEKLNLSEGAKEPIFDQIVTWNMLFSLPERLQLFSIFSVLTFAFASLALWNFHQWWRRGVFIFGFLTLILLVNLGYTYYLTPIQAVVVNAADLRRDAGMQYAAIGEQPVAPGTVIQVLDMTNDGSWIKVVTPSGAFGYLPNHSVRLIGS